MTNEQQKTECRLVFLVQHGEAVPKKENPDCPLTDAGRRTVEQVASWAARVALPVGRIQHSGKLRARETAAVFSEKLQPREGIVADEQMGPTSEVTPLAEMIDEWPCSVMLVGHLPFLNRLAGLLVTGDADREVVRFHNGGVVGLARTGDAWEVWCAVPPELI